MYILWHDCYKSIACISLLLHASPHVVIFLNVLRTCAQDTNILSNALTLVMNSISYKNQIRNYLFPLILSHLIVITICDDSNLYQMRTLATETAKEYDFKCPMSKKIKCVYETSI